MANVLTFSKRATARKTAPSKPLRVNPVAKPSDGDPYEMGEIWVHDTKGSRKFSDGTREQAIQLNQNLAPASESAAHFTFRSAPGARVSEHG